MKTMTIAFPNGGILPADAENPKERNILPHEAVDVPFSYGEQLVRDHFAYVYDLKSPAAAAAAAGASDLDDKKGRKALDAREKSIEAREKAAEKASKDFDARVAKIAASQKAILDARGMVSAATDDAAKASASDALAKAEADFAVLADLKA